MPPQLKPIPPEVIEAGADLLKSTEDLRRWLDKPALWAGGATPWELIDAGRSAEVADALRSLTAGNYL